MTKPPLLSDCERNCNPKHFAAYIGTNVNNLITLTTKEPIGMAHKPKFVQLNNDRTTAVCNNPKKTKAIDGNFTLFTTA